MEEKSSKGKTSTFIHQPCVGLVQLSSHHKLNFNVQFGESSINALKLLAKLSPEDEDHDPNKVISKIRNPDQETKKFVIHFILIQDP